jgi:hypothetical protein
VEITWRSPGGRLSFRMAQKVLCRQYRCIRTISGIGRCFTSRDRKHEMGAASLHLQNEAAYSAPRPPHRRVPSPNTAVAIRALTWAAAGSRVLHEAAAKAPAPVRPDQAPPAEFGMIPLTVPETGRLLSHPPPPGNAAHWLDWRRRHQAGSRRYHQRARLARGTKTAPAG